MTDAIVVVDSGQVLETTESAIVAKNEADRAEQWAKYSEEKANLSEQSALESAQYRDEAREAAQKAQNTANAFDANAEQKTQAFNQNAAEKQAQVDASANAAAQSENNAEIWAEGTDAQVQALGGTHSSKGWAEANENLNYQDITNCITKIPQDIKINTTSRTLTLVSGSKPYKADSSFFTVSSDVTLDITSVAADYLLVYGKDNIIKAVPPSVAFSQNTEPSNPSYLWYNTTTKEVKFKADSGDVTVCSLPIAIIYSDKTVKIFNGFGYIGSTIFVLPGVEGLIPNGRNADGSLNNIKFTVDKVLITTNTGSSDFRHLCIYPDMIFSHPIGAYYDEEENICKETETETSGFCIVSDATFNSGRITSFSPKNVFQAVDRNDTEWASTAGKPSNKYVDLTLQASGTKYTAPANGWFVLSKISTGMQDIVIDLNETRWSVVNSPANGWTCAAFVPCKKNDIVTITYSVKGATNSFRFFYDEGAN